MATCTLIEENGREIDFFVPDGDRGGYVRRGADCTGSQICEGGGFEGSTLRATAATLPAVAKRWYLQQNPSATVKIKELK